MLLHLTISALLGVGLASHSETSRVEAKSYRLDANPHPADSVRQPWALPPRYKYTMTRGFLTMADGVRLAVTWWRPTPKTPGEQFPVLLEFLPYRKDDSFYQRDYPLYTYFVQRGFIMAKVDIRGTGGSDGHLPPREYSDQEIEDAIAIIHQLAAIPGSNGKVGMWGISWGGFNSLQVAMRQPPELKAIIALHASDDLFHDDVHYIDGAMHLDPYALQIDHENALPRTPDYPLDSAYFRNRFEAYPWILTYLKQPVDGPFWRKNALRWNYPAIRIPTYFIGALLDGYRDTPIRALDQLQAPVKVEIGPWNHAWPHDGDPGPNYEWRDRAVRWWNQWLRDEDTGLMKEPRLMLFMRDGDPPDVSLPVAAGSWRFEDWPIARTAWDTLALGLDGRLIDGRTDGQTDSTRRLSIAASDRPTVRPSVALAYLSGFGTATADWWGEATGDMRRDDAGSLTWNGPALSEKIEVIGMPLVRLRVIPGAPLSNWSARLEDVFPDGRISLVTGAVLNGTQSASMLSPQRLRPGQEYTLEIPLHFTTWTFQPGHRIRLAVTNAQFPMIWPTPYPMVSEVELASENSRSETGSPFSALILPTIPSAPARVPDLPIPEAVEHRPDVRDFPVKGVPSQRVTYDVLTGVTSVDWRSGYSWLIGKTRYDNLEREYYETDENHPATSRFLGEESHRIRQNNRDIYLETTIDIRSDSSAFHVRVTRRISQAGNLIRTKVWQEAVKRDFH